MSAKSSKELVDNDESDILASDVPVVMPDLPLFLVLTTPEQFKAIGDPIRKRILNIVRHHPSTAKQIAQRLNATPGSIGHHMHVLEKAGLVQIVARRMTRGIVAKYYTRTARMFNYDVPIESPEQMPTDVQIITSARDELVEATLTIQEDDLRRTGFPHAKLSPERATFFLQRLEALMTEFLSEAPADDGDVYGFCFSFFKSPAYLQDED